MDTIQTFLFDWRRFADLTQEELGKRMGISGAQISRIESGRRTCDLEYLQLFKTVINQRLEEHPHGAVDPDFRIYNYYDPLMVKPDLIGYLRSNPAMQKNVEVWAEDMAELLRTRAQAIVNLSAKLPAE